MTDRIYTIPARIYTIPAREVVPGMLVSGCATPIIDVQRSDTEVRIFVGPGRDVAWSLAPDALVEIRLPGPSPRELLCSCNEWQLGQGADNAGLPASVPCGNWSTMVPPVHHADDCPVCRLRLRLWPVSATWHECELCDGWEVVIDGMEFVVGVEEIQEEAWSHDDLCAAFCEPEVQR